MSESYHFCRALIIVWSCLQSTQMSFHWKYVVFSAAGFLCVKRVNTSHILHIRLCSMYYLLQTNILDPSVLSARKWKEATSCTGEKIHPCKISKERLGVNIIELFKSHELHNINRSEYNYSFWAWMIHYHACIMWTFTHRCLCTCWMVKLFKLNQSSLSLWGLVY